MSSMDPAPIPYPLSEAGPFRHLTLHARRGLISSPIVEVAIDGRSYSLAWGTHVFELPTGRAVHVCVRQATRVPTGLATVLLPAGSASHELEYLGPAHNAKPGAIGEPGSLQREGRGVQWALFGCLGLVALLLAWGVVALVLGSSLR